MLDGSRFGRYCLPSTPPDFTTERALNKVQTLPVGTRVCAYRVRTLQLYMCQTPISILAYLDAYKYMVIMNNINAYITGPRVQLYQINCTPG